MHTFHQFQMAGRKALTTVVLGSMVWLAGPGEAAADPGADARAQAATTAPAPSPISAAATAPATLSATDAEAQIKRLLSHHHEVPLRKDLEHQVPGAREVLDAIARDASAFTFYRQRALAALAQWPDARTMALYEEILNGSATPEALRHHVIAFAARAFEDAAIGMLTPFLSAEDVQLRLSAATAIGRIGSEQAFGLLTKAAQHEADPLVREHMLEAARTVR